MQPSHFAHSISLGSLDVVEGRMLRGNSLVKHPNLDSCCKCIDVHEGLQIPNRGDSDVSCRPCVRRLWDDCRPRYHAQEIVEAVLAEFIKILDNCAISAPLRVVCMGVEPEGVDAAVIHPLCQEAPEGGGPARLHQTGQIGRCS